MGDLLPFSFNGQGVRVMLRDGAPWFVAVDVCRILEIANPRDAMSRLDDDEKGVGSTDTPGGVKDVNIVSEAGLYALVLGSRKPEARAFKRWVTHEVLPSIRKTGGYGETRQLPDLRDPEQVAKLLAHSLTVLTEERAKRLAAESALMDAAPKVDFVNRYVVARGNVGLRLAAKILGQKQHDFIDWLLARGFVYRTGTSRSRSTGKDRTGIILPYAGYEPYFEVKTLITEHEDGDRQRQQTMITPLGITWLAKKLGVEPDMEAA